MTPPAATVAGRRATSGMRPTGRSSRVGGARPPRRVSGPARPGGRTSARPAARRLTAAPAFAPAALARPAVALGGRVAAAAAAIALPQHQPRPSAPPRRRPRPVPRPARRPDLPLGARALAWLGGLPDHRLLDRLIGGRVWIVLIGTLLVGIVTMQLALLRLNAGIGRAVERTSVLEQQNAQLRLTNSQLSDGERIAGVATQMGFVTPPQGSPRFLTASAGDAARALTTMRVPNPNAATAPSAAAPAGVVAGTTPTTSGAGATAPVAASGTLPGSTAAPTTTTAPASPPTAPATGTTAPATGATTPAAAAPSPATAGGASAPPSGGVGGQG